MPDIFQDVLDKAVALHKDMKLDEAERIYQGLLNRAPFEEILLYLISDLHLRKNNNGLAINLLSNLLQNNPKHADAWCNLGAAFRKENDYARAKAAWEKSIEFGGETTAICNNMATLYADHSEPEKALVWIEKALKLEPQDVKAHWERALALLTMGQFEEGWKEYAWRQKLEHFDSRKSVDVPIWDGKRVRHLYIHGEQGIGDEVMFASAIPKMKHLAERITLEVHPKVAPLMKVTWSDFNVITAEAPGDYDAKIPIGSLVGMFGFHPEPYLIPDPSTVMRYRKELKEIGPGPHIALTWIGGSKETRAEDRSMSLAQLAMIRNAYTCVSAQYGDSNPYIDPERAKYGLAKINDASTGLDLHEQAALFKACDAVVTVQQTAVHVAGAVGAKTLAMISPNPPWRYMKGVDRLPWYPSVELIRRGHGEPWTPVIVQTLAKLDSNFSRVPKAKLQAA